MPVRELDVLLEHLPNFVLRFDRTLRCTYLNPASLRASGLVSARFLGKTIADMVGVHAEMATIWDDALERVIATATPETIEAPLQLLSGRTRLRALIFPDGMQTGVPASSALVIAHELAEQSLIAQEHEQLMLQLRAHERRLREILDQYAGTSRAVQTRPTAENHELLLQVTLHERDLLQLIAQGRRNSDIGRLLGLSTGTVRNQLTRLYLKLGATDRTNAAARAVALGLVSTEH